MTKKRLLILGGIVLSALATVPMIHVRSTDRFRLKSPARRAWKARALADLAGIATNRQAASNEVAFLLTAKSSEDEAAWVGTNVLVMTNGEWLVYRNRCAKEAGRIHDLFLAYGSDGKWYYSTFHFCIGMLVLRAEMWGEGKHGSIHEFAKAYSLEEFDGRSDECLKKTWRQKSWQTNLLSGSR